jgi:hypothetical protein
MFTGRRYLGYWEKSQHGHRLGTTTKPCHLVLSAARPEVFGKLVEKEYGWSAKIPALIHRLHPWKFSALTP